LTGLVDAGVALPTGWLWEDGGTYSRTTYANLFAAVTTTLTGHILIGSSSISGSFASLVGQGLEGGGGRGHPDFHDGREHHLDDDRHFPERQRKQLFGASSRICPWGNGDGPTTFNVPDRRYRTPNTVAKIKINEDFKFGIFDTGDADGRAYGAESR